MPPPTDHQYNVRLNDTDNDRLEAVADVYECRPSVMLGIAASDGLAHIIGSETFAVMRARFDEKIARRLRQLEKEAADPWNTSKNTADGDDPADG